MKTRKTFTRLLIIFSVFIFAVSLFLNGCQGTGKKNAGMEIDSTLGLKDFYRDYFPIGVAVSPGALEGEQGEMIKKQFNSLTAENVMKPGPIHPEEDRYNWEAADQIVDFAVANGMKVRGHTLCWHNQTAPWMFVDDDGNQISKEIAFERLKEHIDQVVSRYKGKVYAWDVLNEAIVDDSDTSKVYRESNWYKICGEEYISKVFQWAHDADPNALLYYNDYNTENPVKREKIYQVVKKLQEEGVPIHGVGLQGHWNIGGPSEENIRESIDRFASLGLDVQITELDVVIYSSRADTMDMGFTPEREQRQIDFYTMAFDVFREKKDAITGITFWNVHDGRSWLNRNNRMVYPLLFDENLKPKKVFWEVVRF